MSVFEVAAQQQAESPIRVGAQLAATVIAAIGLVVVAVQLRAQKRAAQRARTVAFTDRWISPELAELASRAARFVEVADARDAVQKIQAWHAASDASHACLPRTPRHPSASKPSKNDVYNFLSFFEIIGAAHALGELDEKAFMLSFGPEPVRFLADGWWFVCWQRDGQPRKAGESTAWSGWEDLSRRIMQLDESIGQAYAPRPTVRMLVLPDPATAGPYEWGLCARLSKALSEHRNAHRVLIGRAFIDDGCAGGHVVDRVIAVPTRFGFDLAAWEADVTRARQAEYQLSRRGPRGLEDLIAKLPADLSA